MNPLLMTLFTTILSSVVAALVGALVAKFKTATKDAADMREMQRATLMMTCRMAIYDDHFSIDEKIEAYIIYRVLGYNHQTKTYMDALVGSDIDEYIEKHKRKD